MTELNEKNSKIDICELKNQNLCHVYKYYSVRDIDSEAIQLEIFLPIRVPEENFKDMINLIRVSCKIDENNWEKGKC